MKPKKKRTYKVWMPVHCFAVCTVRAEDEDQASDKAWDRFDRRKVEFIEYADAGCARVEAVKK